MTRNMRQRRLTRDATKRFAVSDILVSGCFAHSRHWSRKSRSNAYKWTLEAGSPH
jgi:hypothetical protein